ncbi:MAG: BrnT family toxin [Lachnospiraceae bacterium]|nr:BrnT family toxin [Lachnospiraceae bacterium]
MKFEWDEEKERANIRKHRVDFHMAARVFFDPDVLVRYDDIHSTEEDRYIAIGRVDETVLILLVAYTERKDRIRIISARPATKREKERYHYGN